MSAVDWNNVINTLQKVLSISSDEILVVSIFADVSGHEDGLDEGLVEEAQLCGKWWVVILVIDEALFVFGVVLENGVLFFVDIVEAPWLKSFARVLVWVLKVDLEVVFEDLSLSQLTTAKAEGGYIYSAIESSFSLGVNLIVRFALCDRGYTGVGHFEEVHFIVSFIIASLLVNHVAFS